MNLINNFFKERLTDKLNLKRRYVLNFDNFKFVSNLDNLNYCLYDDNMNIYWLKNGKIHRDGDLPANIDFNGISPFYHSNINDVKITRYYKKGLRHRDNDKFGNPQPAVITKNDVYYYNQGVKYFLD